MKNDTPLKIYLGDLTYDTVTISAESMPLNVGYVAAYCKKKFGNKVEISLFKYIKDLEKDNLSEYEEKIPDKEMEEISNELHKLGYINDS